MLLVMEPHSLTTGFLQKGIPSFLSFPSSLSIPHAQVLCEALEWEWGTKTKDSGRKKMWSLLTRD
jgi:hypothetical protein